MIHSDEVKAALIVRDQEPRKVTSSLPEDLKDRICCIARKRGMGLPVPFNNAGNCKASHCCVEYTTMCPGINAWRVLWHCYFVEEVNFHVE